MFFGISQVKAQPRLIKNPALQLNLIASINIVNSISIGQRIHTL